MTQFDFDRQDLYPDGNLSVYRDQSDELRQELQRLQSDLEMSDKVAALIEIPGWIAIRDRVRSMHADAIAALTKNELTPYRQGFNQGRLSVMDVLLTTSPLTPAEIDKRRVQITHIQDRLNQIEEILK